MFGDCTSLTELDVSNFDTSNVTDMSYMFAGCEKLFNWNDDKGYYEQRFVDVRGFNVSNVQNWDNFFWLDGKTIVLNGRPWEELFRK